MGIDALKIASLREESDFFKNYPGIRIEDQNHLLWEENQFPNAIRINGIAKVYEALTEKVCDQIKAEKLPLILAGDHSSAGGSIAGVKKAFPEKRLGVIWIDAHADLHSPYTSPSGNVHGMPLATALASDNLESRINEPSEETLGYWEQMKSAGGVQPKLQASDLVFFGVRDTEAPERSLMKRMGIQNYTVEQCRAGGLERMVELAVGQLADCDLIYLSFDVDSMDPDEVSYGTGTPVKDGFTPAEAEQLIKQLIRKSGKVACFEMVEVNPLLDRQGNKMAQTAFKLLEKITPDLEEYGI